MKLGSNAISRHTINPGQLIGKLTIVKFKIHLFPLYNIYPYLGRHHLFSNIYNKRIIWLGKIDNSDVGFITYNFECSPFSTSDRWNSL